jgi:hypothetical protein
VCLLADQQFSTSPLPLLTGNDVGGCQFCHGVLRSTRVVLMFLGITCGPRSGLSGECPLYILHDRVSADQAAQECYFLGRRSIVATAPADTPANIEHPGSAVQVELCPAVNSIRDTGRNRRCAGASCIMTRPPYTLRGRQVGVSIATAQASSVRVAECAADIVAGTVPVSDESEHRRNDDPAVGRQTQTHSRLGSPYCREDQASWAIAIALSISTFQSGRVS